MRFDSKKPALATLLALGIAILCGVVAGLLGHGHFAGRYAVPARGSEPHAVTPPPLAVTTLPPAAPPPVMTAPAPAEDADADEDDDSDRIADAIGRATRKALDRGEPVRWHKAGQSGYIVVSDAQYYPGRSCRTVSATIIKDDGDQTRSAPHLWCQNDADEDGDWQPVR